MGNYTNVPEEMGFHVSVDAHDIDETTHNFESGVKWDMSTTGYSYDDVGTSDEAMGYLSGATYRQNYREMDDMGYNKEKVDLSRPGHQTTELNDSALYGNVSLLGTAIQYDNVEGIEGDIIDEVDYENVTIVRANMATGSTSDAHKSQGKGNHTHSPSNVSDMDYLSVESFDGNTPESKTVFGNQEVGGSRGAVKTAHQSTYHRDALAPGPVHPDTGSLNSLLYENFDPHRRLPETVQPTANFAANKYTSGIDEYVYQLDQVQPDYKDAFNMAAQGVHETVAENDDLYMNVSASRLQAEMFADRNVSLSTAPADEDEMNYENTTYI